MELRVLSIPVVLIVLSIFASGCGSSGASQDEIEQARKEGSAETRQKLKIERIEEELHSLKKHGHATNQNQGQGQTEGGTSGATAGGTTSCGGTLSVGPNTTCGFAANVEADYYSEIGSGAGTVYSYSPTRERYYSMYCTAGSPHQCTGGNEASVYFP